MRVWRERTDNKYLLLNGDELFEFKNSNTNASTDIEATPIQFAYGDGQWQKQQQQPTEFEIVKITNYTRQHDNIKISNDFRQWMSGDQTISTTTMTAYNDRRQCEQVKFYLIDEPMSQERRVFIDDVQHGPYKSRAGDKFKRENYEIDGRKQGLETSYFNSGRIARTTMYSDGQFSGKDIVYRNDADSSVHVVTEFKNNRVVNRTDYNEDGSYSVKNCGKGDFILEFPIESEFYDSENRLRRKITYPTNRVQLNMTFSMMIMVRSHLTPNTIKMRLTQSSLIGGLGTLPSHH